MNGSLGYHFPGKFWRGYLNFPGKFWRGYSIFQENHTMSHWSQEKPQRDSIFFWRHKSGTEKKVRRSIILVVDEKTTILTEFSKNLGYFFPKQHSQSHYEDPIWAHNDHNIRNGLYFLQSYWNRWISQPLRSIANSKGQSGWGQSRKYPLPQNDSYFLFQKR